MTAKEFLKNNLSKIHEEDIIEDLLQRLFTVDVSEIMIEFTEYHVKEALRQASEKAQTECDEGGETGFVDKNSILNAYPLDNIK